MEPFHQQSFVTAQHHLVLHRHMIDAASSTHEERERFSVWVFSAGTCQWSWGLDPFHDRPTGTRGFENEQSVRVLEDLNAAGRGDVNVQQASLNLLADMGVQPGGLLAKSFGLGVAEGSSDAAVGGDHKGTRRRDRSRFGLQVTIVGKIKQENVGNKTLLTVTFGFAHRPGSHSASGTLLAGVEALLEARGDTAPKFWRGATTIALGRFRFETVVDPPAEGGVAGKYDLYYRGIDELGNVQDLPSRREVVVDR